VTRGSGSRVSVRDDELGGDASGKQVRYINAFRVLVTFASGQALSGESV